MTTEPIAGERRYERKYRIEVAEREVVEAVVRSHPAAFREVHAPRHVNNIYFDTPGARFFTDHVSGVSRRMKIRVRWYGDRRPGDSSSRLELKAKEGAITSKRVFPWSGPVEGNLRVDELPAELSEQVLSLGAVLFNRYRRRYFLSRNGRIRVTVDSDLEFCRPHRLDKAPLERYEDAGVILELKHSVEDFREGTEVSSRLPFSLSKNSKYITGMSLLLQIA